MGSGCLSLVLIVAFIYLISKFGWWLLLFGIAIPLTIYIYKRYSSKSIKAPEQIELSVSEDIVLEFVSQGKSPIFVSFGQESEEILATDYVFQLIPPVQKMSLPKEILLGRISQFPKETKLGLFELIIPDFIASSESYYKSLISNTITVGDIQ